MSAFTPIAARGAGQPSLKLASKIFTTETRRHSAARPQAFSFRLSAFSLFGWRRLVLAGSLRAREIVAACKETKN
jgi:hypothetical protein